MAARKKSKKHMTKQSGRVHHRKKPLWHKPVHPFVAWGIIGAVSLFGIFALLPNFLVTDTLASGRGSGANAGFDAFGYNKRARAFSGEADGVDRKLDGAVWGDKTYAHDHLVMKWNAEWDRGNDEGWSNPPYSAWEDNEWNGQGKDGSGESWHYKIVWVGPCGAYGTPLDNGGYCIWNQFAVIMSQGTFDKQHFWDVVARPAGYGAYNQ